MRGDESDNGEVTALRRAWALFILVCIAGGCLTAGGPGFRSQKYLDEHFAKHGSEFGKISKSEYLQLAQSLRDEPPGSSILEAKRADGVVTKFDLKRGYFGAYERTGTIRTFFIPAAGESYFRRQAKRP